jgi:hypothetical protein
VAIGGFTSAKDSIRVKELLNALADAGLTNGRRLKDIKDKNFNVTKDEMLHYIRDATLNPVDRRYNPPQRLEKFKKFLLKHGIEFEIPQSKPRTSSRRTK